MSAISDDGGKPVMRCSSPRTARTEDIVMLNIVFRSRLKPGLRAKMRFVGLAAVLALSSCVSMLMIAMPSSADDMSEHTVIELTARTIFGEQEQLFRVEREGPRIYSWVREPGSEASNDLTDRNFKFILAEFEKLPEGDIPNECYRNRIDLVARLRDGTVVNKSSCFGNEIEKPGFARFVTILRMAS